MSDLLHGDLLARQGAEQDRELCFKLLRRDDEGRLWSLFESLREMRVMYYPGTWNSADIRYSGLLAFFTEEHARAFVKGCGEKWLKGVELWQCLGWRRITLPDRALTIDEGVGPGLVEIWWQAVEAGPARLWTAPGLGRMWPEGTVAFTSILPDRLLARELKPA